MGSFRDSEKPAGGTFRQMDTAERKPRKRSFIDEATGFMANVNRGLGIGDELVAAGETAKDVITGRRSIGQLPQVFRENMAEQRAVEDDFAARRPLTARFAQGTGNAATVVVPTPAAPAALLANSSRLTNAARGAVTAGMVGAGYAAVDRGSAGERLQAASETARNPLVLGLGAAGGALGPSRPRTKVPQRVDPDVELLAREGVPLTPGQMGGRVRRSAEEAGTSLPMVGDAIQARRREGVEGFVRATQNRALEHGLGERLDDAIPTGTESIKHVGDRLSKGYEEAMPNVGVRLDAGFADDFRSALGNVSTLTPQNQQRLFKIITERLDSRIPQNGVIDGQLYKRLQSDLDHEVGRFSGAPDPDARAMGEALSGVQQALEAAARRQDPRFAQTIDRLDRGWAELARIETAASRAKDLDGIFTPSQYAQSIRAGDGRIRNRGVARGEALSQDLARAGQRVLPQKMPDSGTTGRAMWGMLASAPGAVLGALTGGGVGAAAGAAAGVGATAAGLGAASRLYTPEAIQAANTALNARIGRQAQEAALAELRAMAAQNPQLQQLYAEVVGRLSRGGAVTAASASSR